MIYLRLMVAILSLAAVRTISQEELKFLESIFGARPPRGNDTVSKCSLEGNCVPESLLRCRRGSVLYNNYFNRSLSKEEKESLRQASCGWKSGVPQVCCKNLTGCGISSVKPETIGGRKSKLGAWPWMAAIYYKNSVSGEVTCECEGSIIDKEWILTAAHCIPPSFGGDNLQIDHVRVGDLDLIATDDGATPVHVNISRVVVHPKYDNVSYLRDIALIKLNQSLNYTTLIRPICLPVNDARDYLDDGYYHKKQGYAAGWSYVHPRSLTETTHLIDVDLNMMPGDKCRTNYSVRGMESDIDDSVLCTVAEEKDTCDGDAGGPLMFIEDGRWIQVGITSWGMECAGPYFPGVYTKVARFMNWIKKETGSAF